MPKNRSILTYFHPFQTVIVPVPFIYIRADGDHRGTSRQAIAKHLKSEFASDNTTALRKALKTGVTKNKLTQEGQRFRVVGDKAVEAPDNGFRQKDLELGDGEACKNGDVVTVAYKGKLTDGSVFDKAKKFVFTLGAGDVIKGEFTKFVNKFGLNEYDKIHRAFSLLDYDQDGSINVLEIERALRLAQVVARTSLTEWLTDCLLK